MKNLILMILFFCSIKCYSQIVELPLPIRQTKQTIPFPPKKNKDGTFNFDKLSFERESKIVLCPNQDVKFGVSVFTKGNKIIICDTLGQILYSQIARKGNYVSVPNSSYQYFVIYDLINDSMKNVVGYNPIDDFHRDIIFGYKKKVDALVKITAKLK